MSYFKELYIRIREAGYDPAKLKVPSCPCGGERHIIGFTAPRTLMVQCGRCHVIQEIQAPAAAPKSYVERFTR